MFKIQNGEPRDSYERGVPGNFEQTATRRVTHPPLARVLSRIRRACCEFHPRTSCREKSFSPQVCLITCVVVVERSSSAFREALIYFFFRKQPARRRTQLVFLLGRAGRPLCGVWDAQITRETVNTALVFGPSVKNYLQPKRSIISVSGLSPSQEGSGLSFGSSLELTRQNQNYAGCSETFTNCFSLFRVLLC